MGIAVSILPKVLQPLEPDIIQETANAPFKSSLTRNLVGDLQLLTPHYYPEFVEKYGYKNE